MKFLKWVFIVIAAVLLLAVFVGLPYMEKQTKKHSPETTASLNEKGFDLSVTYSSPAKKGRVIFGGLVPFDRVWRTGANEPTTFTTKTDIKIMNNVLPAGTYSLWTIPGSERWTVIFNEEVPDWGVTLMSNGEETTRNPEKDIVQVEVLSKKLARTQERFTITFQDTGFIHLAISWDDTIVLVPINS